MYQKRIAKWDNLKLLLIFCVVVGHTIYTFHNTSLLARSLYLFLYSFHMPAFLFVAGLFSKHAVRARRYETVVEYLVIYVVMKFLETIGDYLAKGKLSFHFLWEAGPAWFALALAVFLFVTMLVQEMNPRVLFLSALLVGCVAGLDTHFGDHFASMRICVFYPAFLAGFYLEPTWFELRWRTLRKRVGLRVLSALVLAGCLFLSLRYQKQLYPLVKLFKGKYEYKEMDYGLEGVLIRLACYLFWAVMICAVLMLAGEMERFYTWLGQRTMSVFIWHSLVLVTVLNLCHCTALLKFCFPHLYVLAADCVAGILTVLCAYLPQIRMPKPTVVVTEPEGGEREEEDEYET